MIQTLKNALLHGDGVPIALHIGTAGFQNQFMGAAVARRMPSHAVASKLAINIP